MKRNYNLTDGQKAILEKEDCKFIEIYFDETKKRPEKRLKYLHNRCGKIVDVRFDHFFYDGDRCSCLRKLQNAETKTTKDYQNKIDLIFGPKEYTAISEYIGRKKEISIRHKCGYEYKIKRAEYLFDIKGNGGKCPICSNRSLNTKEILESKFKRVGADLTILDNFKSGKTYYHVFNNQCFHDYFIRTYDVLRHNSTNKYFCPICKHTNSSEAELQIKEFLNQYKPFKKVHKTFNGHRYELDLYNDTLKLGIEYNGLYWHSERIIEKNYHIKKTNIFEENGIRLIHIFEDEWKYKQDIVKDKLLSIMGILKERIYAKKCIIREIDSSTRNTFLNENHIQGADMASISLGMFYSNELVAVMSFSKLRKALGNKTSKDWVYELSRFAGKLGYTIVGGFSKLLTYAEKHYNIKEIITYADLRFTSRNKNVYLTNGFILDHIAKPSYYYSKCGTTAIREYRYNYRKQLLKDKFPEIYDDKKTEFQIMDEAGYYRIWDCGNLVYKKVIK